MRPTLLNEIDQVWRELQDLLARLAVEVPHHRALVDHHYQIDPKGDLIPALRGVYSLEELKGIWDILRLQLARGEKFVCKYMLEVKEGNAIHSPVSTLASLYNSWEPIVPIPQRIRDYMTRVPSMYNSDLLPASEAAPTSASD